MSGSFKLVEIGDQEKEKRKKRKEKKEKKREENLRWSLFFIIIDIILCRMRRLG